MAQFCKKLKKWEMLFCFTFSNKIIWMICYSTLPNSSFRRINWEVLPFHMFHPEQNGTTLFSNYTYRTISDGIRASAHKGSLFSRTKFHTSHIVFKSVDILWAHNFFWETIWRTDEFVKSPGRILNLESSFPRKIYMFNVLYLWLCSFLHIWLCVSSLRGKLKYI